VTYSNFLETHPLIFTRAEHPIEANEWLQTLEQKFRVIPQCTDTQKAKFAGLQLQGPAGTWWSNFLTRQPSEGTITWDEFKTAFRAQFILAGVMKMKFEEFLKLEQGSKSVMEYTNAFDHLAQYAPEHVDTETKKRDCYLRDLNVRMQDKLSTCTFADYSSAVSMAFTAEGKMKTLDEALKKEESLKRKIPSFGAPSHAPQCLKVIYRGPARSGYRPPPPPPQQQWMARNPYNVPRPGNPQASGSRNVSTPTGAQPCYNCG
jgi:hypothetical protein